MESANYWSQVARLKVTRRGVLRSAAVGGAGLAGAALIGCGGGKSDSGAATATRAAGATGTPTATAAAAAKPRFGGVLKMGTNADPPSWSVFTASGTTVTMNSYAYDKLLTIATGPGHGAGTTDVIPEIATALPERPDTQTYVFKIRQGVKFQNVAPVNGRPMTIDDVKYSIDTLRNNATYKADFAPVISVTAADAQTLIVKTDQPNAPLLNNIAHHFGWRIFPKEIIDSKITDNNAIGTGPYIRAQWDQGNKIVFKKNPDYWNKDNVAYLDEIQHLIIPDANTMMAALQAKQIDTAASGLGCGPTQDMAKQVKGQATTQMYPGICRWIAFNTTKPPFNDLRVRRAVSLAYDREAENQVLFCGEANLRGLLWQKEALKPEAIPDMANYLKYDVKQAKDLMAAAGFANGFKTDVAWSPQYVNVAGYTASLERYGSDLKQIGVTINPISHEYGKWIAEMYRPPFNWDGMLWSPTRYYVDPDPLTYYWLHPKGITNQSRVNDPALTALIEKQRLQVDPKERWNTLHDIQKLEAANMWYAWRPSGPGTIFQANRVHDYVYNEILDHREFRHIWVDA